MEVLDRNLFDMYNANLTKLLKNKEYVSVDDAILTSVIELSPGNKMDERMSNWIELNWFKFSFQLRLLLFKKFEFTSIPQMICYSNWAISILMRMKPHGS